MKLIVATNNLGYIGACGEIPWHSSADFAHFKEKTFGDVIIMGSTTFRYSLKSKPLKGRHNIVIGKDNEFKTLFDALEEAVMISHAESCDIWVIGGEQIYNQLVHLCDEIHISLINDDQEGDAKFEIPTNYRGKVFTYNFEPNEQTTNSQQTT